MIRPSVCCKWLGLFAVAWLVLPPLAFFALPFPADHTSEAALAALLSGSVVKRTYSFSHYYPRGLGLRESRFAPDESWPYFIVDYALNQSERTLTLNGFALSLDQPVATFGLNVPAAVPQLIYKSSWPPGDVVPMDSFVRDAIGTDTAFAIVVVAAETRKEADRYTLELRAASDDDQEPIKDPNLLLSVSWRDAAAISELTVPGPQLSWAPSKLYSFRLAVLMSWAGLVPVFDVFYGFVAWLFNLVGELVIVPILLMASVGSFVWLVWWIYSGRPALEEVLASTNARFVRSVRLQRTANSLADMRLEGTRINLFVAYDIWRQTPGSMDLSKDSAVRMDLESANSLQDVR